MSRAPKAPPANTSPAACKLRETAIAFAKTLHDPVKDPHDVSGQRRNRALLKAAIAYVNEVTKQDGHPLLEALKDAREFMSADNYNTLEGWADACDSALNTIHKYDPNWEVP